MDEQQPIDDVLARLARKAQSPDAEHDKEQAWQRLDRRIGRTALRPAAPSVRRHTTWRVAASVVGVLMAGALAYAIAVHTATQFRPAVADHTATAVEETTLALTFRDTPLGQIADSLAVRYGVSIVVDNDALAAAPFTATFSADETLPAILTALAEAGCLRWEAETGTDTIRIYAE